MSGLAGCSPSPIGPELGAILAGTAAEPFLAEGVTRRFDSMRSFSGDAMSALEYVVAA